MAGMGGSSVGVGVGVGVGICDGHRWLIVVNATIFLPISEDAFVNADNLLLAWYREASNHTKGVHCVMSVFGISETMTKAMMYLSTCDIKFVHPGVINIEQLSFVSCQNVIAYHVGGSALVYSPLRQQNRNGPPFLSLRGRDGTLEIFVEYSTMLNVQYLPPIVTLSAASGGGPASPARNNKDGLVPVIMQQPVLYSVSASLDDAGDVHMDNVGDDRMTTTMTKTSSCCPIMLRCSVGTSAHTR